MRDKLAVLGFSQYKRDKVHNEIRLDDLRSHKGGMTMQEKKNQLLIKKGE